MSGESYKLKNLNGERDTTRGLPTIGKPFVNKKEEKFSPFSGSHATAKR